MFYKINKKINRGNMDFTGWNHVEITAYIFQDKRGKEEIIKLVENRINNENIKNNQGSDFDYKNDKG
jgi:hypothetical protein